MLRRGLSLLLVLGGIAVAEEPPRVAFPAPELARPSPRPARNLPPPQPWNIVVVIMESAGLSYAFTPRADDSAMPYVRELASRGWHLSQHFSPSNSSGRSIFALLSGLHPLPQEKPMFETSGGVHVPSLATLLGAGWDSFLVTPSNVTWFFPYAFVRHSGMELHGRDKIGTSDDSRALDWFLKRVAAARKPFFGVYYTVAGHTPYDDQGPRYRRFHGESRRDKYLNNLVFVDAQIKRMMGELERLGVLDRTIVVLVGDHGEAFNQHPGNYAHSRRSFNENFQTPGVIYQPKIFPSRVIAQRTSHVDIVPTLLDAVGRPGGERLQGESLFQTDLQRKYLFLFGNENTLSSIDGAGKKLQLSLGTGACWVYDLAVDPGERARLPCAPAYAEQQRDLRFYADFQRRVLPAYNEASKRKR